MELIELKGTPRALGIGFGEHCREAISELYAIRMANAIAQTKLYGRRTVSEADLLNLAEQCLEPVAEFHPAGLEELQGIAEGAQLDLAQIWAMNALTDLRDVAAFGPPPDGEGCSSIMVSPPASSTNEAYMAQTWDLGTDNMPYVRMVSRAPTDGPKTLCMTTVGCLSLIGLNEHGIAVGTTNLRTRDSRIGVGYLDVIHRALSMRTLEAAVKVVRTAPRAGAHYFSVVDGEGRAVGLECSATQVSEVPVAHGTYVHCNHGIEEAVMQREVPNTPMASSHYRQQRLEHLAAEPSSLSPSDLKTFLADTEGGELAINRKDFGNISTNGAVVVAPGQRRLWVIHGPADSGEWREYAFGEEAKL